MQLKETVMMLTTGLEEPVVCISSKIWLCFKEENCYARLQQKQWINSLFSNWLTSHLEIEQTIKLLLTSNARSTHTLRDKRSLSFYTTWTTVMLLMQIKGKGNLLYFPDLKRGNETNNRGTGPSLFS
jgi:hypothetical protein